MKITLDLESRIQACPKLAPWRFASQMNLDARTEVKPFKRTGKRA
jgi:hypothetical protein